MDPLSQMLAKRNSRKRKLIQEELSDDELFFSSGNADEEESVGTVAQAILNVVQKPEKKPKMPNRDRDQQKQLWTDGYQNWTDEEFKENLRIDRGTFQFILEKIDIDIRKEPTVMVPNPIETHRQLGLTIYRMAHGCSFKVLQHIFGVSI